MSNFYAHLPSSGKRMLWEEAQHRRGGEDDEEAPCGVQEAEGLIAEGHRPQAVRSGPEQKSSSVMIASGKNICKVKFMLLNGNENSPRLKSDCNFILDVLHFDIYYSHSMGEMYRVTILVREKPPVDLDMECSAILPGQ